MARFKAVDMSPRMLPVVLEEQLIAGTFEHALHTIERVCVENVLFMAISGDTQPAYTTSPASCAA